MPLLSQCWKNNPYLTALMVRCELSYLILVLLILIKTTLHNKFKGLFTTGICQPIRILCLTTNSIPQGINDKLPGSA